MASSACWLSCFLNCSDRTSVLLEERSRHLILSNSIVGIWTLIRWCNPKIKTSWHSISEFELVDLGGRDRLVAGGSVGDTFLFFPLNNFTSRKDDRFSPVGNCDREVLHVVTSVCRSPYKCYRQT